MSNSQQKITGILLSGGKSSRMGKEKGNIKIGNYFMYQYPLRVLESLCDEILISTCGNLEMEENYEQICDEVPNIGPIGGLYTCLKRSSNELNIVLSYDLPMVNEDLFKDLLKSRDQFDIILPALKEGNPEPLCGIYKKSTQDVFGKMIDRKVYAVRKALPLVRSKIIVLEETSPFFRADIFLNINRETDLKDLHIEKY